MMASSTAKPPAKRTRTDPVIGLDVGGKVYYCRRSTLLNGDLSYFSARFGPDSMLSPEVDRVDEHGREIYFIDRNPKLFEFILDYFRMQKVPSEMGTFQESPKIWRALRDEADFFALDGLVSLLKVTFSCSPDEDGGKGILYYLGTNKGKDDEYVNPYTRKIIDVTGWFDEIDSCDNLSESSLSLGSNKAREYLVQYRPAAMEDIKEVKEEDMQEHIPDWSLPVRINFPTLLCCDHSSERLPVIIDLRKTLVSPTHYSLRHGGCCGMEGNWNFEASTDRENWVLLHTGKSDDGHNLTQIRCGDRQRRGETKMFNDLLLGANETERRKIHCDYMERHYRDTWEVDNSSGFFRYFRIIGADDPDEVTSCLHCIGLEIYGNVYEE